MSRFLRRHIAEMRGYAYGAQPLDPEVVKLNTNENPGPPAPGVAALLRTLDVESLRRYPEATAAAFRRLAAEYHGLAPGQVIATRGGDELLRLLFTSCMEPGAGFGMVTPGYSLYPVLAAIQQCEVIEFPLGEDFALPADLAARMNARGVRMTCISNPHAPSGHYFTREEIEHFLDRFDGLLLLDEAYADFVEPAIAWGAAELVRERDQLVVLRSLSKGYSLAGLRFGYGLGPADLLRGISEKTRDSYNLDAISQQLAVAALRDRAHAERNWRLVRRRRAELRRGLQQLGFSVPPSQGNYLLAFAPAGVQAGELQLALQRRKLLVRWFDEPRISGALRITVGREEEQARLLECLAELLAAGGKSEAGKASFSCPSSGDGDFSPP